MSQSTTVPLARITASQILQALRSHHSKAALVPEVVIGTRDHAAWEAYYAALDAGETAESPVETRRIDALMFDGLQRTAIEIKIDRADVKRESWRKVAPWREVVHRFIYAVPAGLIEANEVPVYGCGLWWVHPDGQVEVRRRAQIQKYPEPLPQNVISALAYRAAGVSRITPQTRS